MRGRVHGPGGKFRAELLQLQVLTNLNSTKRKRKEAMKVIVLEKWL
jgi:hypothetical protein